MLSSKKLCLGLKNNLTLSLKASSTDTPYSQVNTLMTEVKMPFGAAGRQCIYFESMPLSGITFHRRGTLFFCKIAFATIGWEESKQSPPRFFF